ncbi:MAG: sulfatase-like hydrolase/transferase, partial [Verrucomicrobiota bacterium]
GMLHQEVEDTYGEDHSVDFLLQFLSEHQKDKTFLYYPMALPHWPMVPTPLSPDWADPEKRLHESTEYFPDMVKYMDLLIGRLVEGISDLGLLEDTLILFYSDNGTDRRITSHLRGEPVIGGKNQTTQAGIRVPLIASWPGHLASGLCHDLVESSDFLPTLAQLAGSDVAYPHNWPVPTDGLSFAPQLLGTATDLTPRREWAFFWYDPRPGWDKDSFSRSIFALDHDYKLFADGRFYQVSGEVLREDPLDANELTPLQLASRAKLQTAIDTMMQPPMSWAGANEVDAFGNEFTQ